MRRLSASALLRALATTTLAALGAAAPAFAAGTHTIGVSATILSKNNCQFTNAGATALAFGSIDPSSLAPVTATASMTFRCTGSSAVATYFVASDDGLYETGVGAPRMRHATSPANYLPYTLNLPQTASVPRNTVTTLTITGTVAVADFQNALAGAYADTVVMTMTP
jgi:spore coat protein U-like protein